jgi:hypothetical protein
VRNFQCFLLISTNTNLKAGENQIPLDITNATQGINMVSITIDGIAYSRKAMVE